MAKRKKTIIAGPIVKTIIYTAPEPQDGKRARAEKSKMTSAAQKAMNDKTARGGWKCAGGKLHRAGPVRYPDIP